MTELRAAPAQGPPDVESRLWAALTNASPLLFGMGLAIPTFGWADSRTRRPFATFQSLQALGYQTLGYTVWLLLYLALLILISIVPIPFVAASEGGSDAFFFFWMAAFLAVVIEMWAAYLLLPVIAVVFTALGRNFYYPILGRRLEKYLRYDPLAGEDATLDEEKSDRWVASMGHFAVILPLWGLTSPLVALLTQRDRSSFLRFQSWQAIAFQLIVLAAIAGMFAFYMLGFFGFVLSMAVGGGSEPPAAGLIFFLAMMCCMGGLGLLIPFFHLLGQWAGLRILQGHDPYYPLLGRLIAHRTGYLPRPPAEGGE